MARDLNSSGYYISISSALMTAVPMTFAAWVYVHGSAAHTTFRIIDSATTTANDFSLYVDGTNLPTAESKAASSSSSAQASALTASTWAHVAAVFASATSRTAYLNGTAGTANTTSSTPSGLLLTRFGENTNMAIGFVAAWNVALTASDITSLAAGASPRKVKPASLKSYARLDGVSSPEPDLCFSGGWTLNGGTIPAFASPRLYSP